MENKNKAVTHDDLVYYACNRLLDAASDKKHLDKVDAARLAFIAYSRKPLGNQLQIVAQDAFDDFVKLTTL